MLLGEIQPRLQLVRGSPPTDLLASNSDVEICWRRLRALRVPGTAVNLQVVARHGLVVTRPEAELQRSDAGMPGC